MTWGEFELHSWNDTDLMQDDFKLFLGFYNFYILDFWPHNIQQQ